jgi:hypothetical protein
MFKDAKTGTTDFRRFIYLPKMVMLASHNSTPLSAHTLTVPTMASVTCDVNSKFLVSIIEARPVLGDRTLETYKDKNFTLKALREICRTVHPDIKSMDKIHSK